MGTSICVKSSQQSQQEIKIIQQPSNKLFGPPNLFKPTPIISILITDELVEKEESLKNEQGQSQNERQIDQLLFYTAQQSEEIDSQQQNPWIKKNFIIEAINVSKLKNDDMNNSNNGNLNNSFDQKNSFPETSKEKSILKKRSGQESSNISISAGSQRSIKKVTFDKKQQVLYTKYKN